MTLKYAELSHTPNNIGKALQLISRMKIEFKDTLAAKDYCQRALKVYQDMGNHMGVAQRYPNCLNYNFRIIKQR